jgi:hypothetical protein
MVSEKKLAANRANALKSTGPKTAEGKRVASRNAITHGLFCVDVVLPGEDSAAFEVLKIEMLQAFKPQHAGELLLVERMVIAQWHLRRLRRIDQRSHPGLHQHLIKHWTHYKEFPEEPQPDEWTASKVLLTGNGSESREKHEYRLEASIHRNLRELRKLRTPIRGYQEPESCPYLEEEQVEEQNDENEATEETSAERTSAEQREPQAARKCENEPTESGAQHDRVSIVRNEPNSDASP